MTHRKIAEKANVSVSTVSKALSGSKEVSTELAAKIHKIAVEMGYFKEKSKRKLEYLKEKTPLIAIISPEIISIHYSEMITYIKNDIESRRGRVAVYIDDFDVEKYKNIIEKITLGKNTDGIISFSAYNLDVKPDIPIVCMCEMKKKYWCDTVCVDTHAIIGDLIKYLVSLGHRRIGFVGEPLTMSKQNIFVEEMNKLCLNVDENDLYTIDERFEKIGEVAAELITERSYFPTAFVTGYDEVAIGLVSGFVKAGLNVPEDVSVVGMNDVHYGIYTKKPPTTVKLFYDEQSRIAVNLIYEKIFCKDSPTQNVIINHEIIVRDTTGNAPDRQVYN